MKRRIQTLFLIPIIIVNIGLAHAQENWPHWRGPNHNGISAAPDLPMTWSQTKNIVWKTPLPSWSAGTPIIWGDRIFVTSPSKPEPKTEQPNREETSVLYWKK